MPHPGQILEPQVSIAVDRPLLFAATWIVLPGPTPWLLPLAVGAPELSRCSPDSGASLLPSFALFDDGPSRIKMTLVVVGDVKTVKDQLTPWAQS